MNKNMLLKTLVMGVVVLFVGVSVTTSTGKIDTVITKMNDGSLLGYVNDTSGYPIEGALVRVHFHETYEEDYSDEDGFYHVTNIPICWCLKNATCSKDDYKTEWVLLGIYENTTHDFILTSGNQPPEAPTIKGKWLIREPGPYDYKFKAIDSDGDDVRYFIDWDDGNIEWTDYYASGEDVIVSHTWSCKGAMTVRAYAEDIHGAIGPTGYLEHRSKSTEDNTKNEISENEDSSNAPENIYENTNCFVIGSVDEAFNLVDSDNGSIVFGFKNDDTNSEFPSGGWIYTNGDNGKWIYWSRLKGKFFGDIRSYGISHWWTSEDLTLYVAVDGYRGLALGGFPWRETEPSGAHCWFIGYADYVKIRTA